MNDKLTGIINRLRVAPRSMREPLIAELIAALAEETGSKPDAPSKKGFTQCLNDSPAIATLRAALMWPEVKSSPKAVAKISRTLRMLGEAA